MAPLLKSNTELTNGEAKHLKQEEDTQDGILFGMQSMSAMVLPMAIRSAIELGIFDILAKAGEDGVKLSAEDISVKIGSNNPQAPQLLDRLLGLLTSHSMLYCSVPEHHQQGRGPPQRLYSLAPASKYYVTDDDGVSFGPSLALLLDKVFLESWMELKGAILEGGTPFNRVHGMHVFEYPRVEPTFNDVFNKAMLNLTTIVMKRILEFYQGFEHIHILVDVGGGLGVNLKLITSKYPHVQGINFDLPHVIEHALTYPGVEHVGGDMFEGVPNGDAIFMKWILHDWSDEDCLKLLQNCHKAIPANGKVIVVESVLPSLPESTATAKTGFQGDLLMMTLNSGGKERTQQEYLDLATASGFSGIRFVCSVSGFSVMEFFK